MFLLQVFLFVFEMFLIPENVGCFTFLLMDMEQRQLFSFVVMTMSVGMIIPNMEKWKMFQTTNQMSDAFGCFQ